MWGERDYCSLVSTKLSNSAYPILFAVCTYESVRVSQFLVVMIDMSDVLQVGGAEERGSSGRGGEA